MSLRLTRFATAGTFIILSSLAGCSSQDSPNGAGGSAAGGVHASGGSGGLAAAGQSSGGLGGSGLSTGGQSTGGLQNTGGIQNVSGASGAGTSGSGVGGQHTGGAAAGGASSGGSGGEEAIPPTFDTLKLVLKSNLGCLGADCHGGGNQQAPTFTITDKLYSTLTTTMSPDCGNIPLVKPGKPDESALVKILKGPCGTISRMPAGCTEQDDNCVPAEYIAAITQWIANGAPQ